MNENDKNVDDGNAHDSETTPSHGGGRLTIYIILSILAAILLAISLPATAAKLFRDSGKLVQGPR